jgi:hypothetical protein
MKVGISVLIKWANREAAERFARALEVFREVAEDMPWRPELKEAIEDAEYAAENITVQGEDDGAER